MDNKKNDDNISPLQNISKHLQDYFIEIKEFSDNANKISEFLVIFQIKITNMHNLENLQQLETFNEKLIECINYLRDNEYGIGRAAKQNLSRTAEQSYRVKFENIQIVFNIYTAYYKSFKRDIINTLVKQNTNKVKVSEILENINNSKLVDYYIQLVSDQTGKKAEFIFNMMRLEIEFSLGKYNYDNKQFIYVPNYTELSKQFIKKLPIGNNIIINRLMKNNAIYVTPKSDLKDYYSKCICENDLLYKTRDWYPHKFINNTDNFSVEFDEKKVTEFVDKIINAKDFTTLSVESFIIQFRVFERFDPTTYREMVLSTFEKYKLSKILLRPHQIVEQKLELNFDILDKKVMTMYKNKVADVKIDSSDFAREIQKCKGKCQLKDVYYIVKNIIYKHYKFNEDNINYSTKTIVNNICILSAKYIMQHLKHAGKKDTESYYELFQQSFMHGEDTSRLVVLENLM